MGLTRNKCRILLRQLTTYRAPSFSVSVEAELFHKGRESRHKRPMEETLHRMYQEAAERFGWKKAPRARIAVHVRVFAYGTSPEIHNLVKFYIDPLRGLLFNDDEQVSLISSVLWRPPPGKARGQEEKRRDGQLYIEVERLTDYKRKFDLFEELSREFPDLVQEDERSPWDYGMKPYPADLLAALELAPVERGAYDRLVKQRQQAVYLRGNTVSWHHRPGGGRSEALRAVAEALRAWESCVFELGELPTMEGDKDAFCAGIRERIEVAAALLRLPLPFVMPVDVQFEISPGTEKIRQDLDNIALQVLRGASPTLLESRRAYVHAYRIYVTTPRVDGRVKPALRMRLLPGGTIQQFYSRMDHVFEEGRNRLRELLG